MTMQSVVRSVHVLEAVARHEPIGVAELARLLELPKSTVQRSLNTLAELDWLELVDGGLTRWALGSRARQLGRRASREIGLREAALEPMQRLRDHTAETIHLGVPDGLRFVVLIERMDSTQPVRTFNELGTRTPVHATSTGLSVLAHLPSERVEKLISGGLERYSHTTITDPEALRAELQGIRERGYAVNLCQYRPQVAAVGAAILYKDKSPAAGICISMPDSRFSQRQVPRWGELVSKTAADITARLSESGSDVHSTAG